MLKISMYAVTFYSAVKTKGNGRHGKALMKLIKGINIGNIFAKDFPFYIILAHRIRKLYVKIYIEFYYFYTFL